LMVALIFLAMSARYHVRPIGFQAGRMRVLALPVCRAAGA
jgi:hypothetical protein